MAILATAVWEVQSGGSDTNGASYDSAISGAATDYSQQASAQLSVTDAVTNGTTTVTSATGGFTSAMIGNGCYMSGAGATTGTYFITAVGSTNSITVDRSPGTGSGNTLNVGGAAASPGWVSGQMIGGNIMYIKNGTYTVTSASTNIAAGCLSLPASTSTNATKIIGYTTTRGDGAPTRPTIKSDGVITTFTLVTMTGGNYIEGIIVDGNNRTSSKGISCSTGTFTRVTNCKALNCTNMGFSNIMLLLFCEASGCSTQIPFQGGIIHYGCVAQNNTVSGLTTASGSVAINCIAANNTGSTSVHGFSYSAGSEFINCVSYGNGGSGFMNTNIATVRQNTMINCHAENNGVYGYNTNAANSDVDMILNCSAYNNTSGTYNSANIRALNVINFITCSATVFNNAAGNDFSLNKTVTGGALLRGLAIPGASYYPLPGISTPSYPDIGAAQHQDTPAIYSITE